MSNSTADNNWDLAPWPCGHKDPVFRSIYSQTCAVCDEVRWSPEMHEQRQATLLVVMSNYGISRKLVETMIANQYGSSVAIATLLISGDLVEHEGNLFCYVTGSSSRRGAK